MTVIWKAWHSQNWKRRRKEIDDMTKKLIVPIASDYLDKLIEQRRADTERIGALVCQLANYQSARVRDVYEKAWLSKRMSYFEDQLRSLLSPAAFKAILDTAPQTETSPQIETKP
jgi:hypothetical protein